MILKTNLVLTTPNSLESEENPELRENLREYYEKSMKRPDFDEERIVNDILCHNYSFL